MSGAESHRGIHIFCRPISPGALRPIKRQLLPVLGKEILPEEFTHMLKQISEATDHRVIPPYSLFGLGYIGDVHSGNDDYNKADSERQ